MARGGVAVAAAGGLAGLGYYLVVSGKLTIDTGWGRQVRPLGPFGVEIAAPASTVFDVIAGPYLGRTPRAMAANRVADAWQAAVRSSLAGIQVEAERRARSNAARGGQDHEEQADGD